jgi:hypothetical protein
MVLCHPKYLGVDIRVRTGQSRGARHRETWREIRRAHPETNLSAIVERFAEPHEQVVERAVGQSSNDLRSDPSNPSGKPPGKMERFAERSQYAIWQAGGHASYELPCDTSKPLRSPPGTRCTIRRATRASHRASSQESVVGFAE